MEPSNKIIKLSKNSIKLEEVTTNLCNLIHNNEITSLILEKKKYKFTLQHFIRILNEIEKNTSLQTLEIFFKFININELKHILTKLVNNANINQLIFYEPNFNEKKNCLKELFDLFSTAKITKFTLSNYQYDIELNPTFINDFKNAIKLSSLTELKLWFNNFQITDIIQIIEALPSTIKNFTLSFNDNLNIVQHTIEDTIITNFTNAIYNSQIETLSISKNIFTCQQFIMIIEKLPLTIKDFQFDLYDNNYGIDSIYYDMKNLAQVIYNNQKLISISCNYKVGWGFNNLPNLYHTDNNQYELIIQHISKFKLNIDIRSKIVVQRNLRQQFNKQIITNLLLCAYKQQFSYLPNEILTIVCSFINCKNLFDIKNNIKKKFYEDFHKEYNTHIEFIKFRYDEQIKFVEKLNKRKQFERATELRNTAINLYNYEAQNIYQSKVSFLNKLTTYTQILNNCF
jgi:hypothetical protein